MKYKQLYMCVDCEMTGALHVLGSETIDEVISQMVDEHKKISPRCASPSSRFRVLFNPGKPKSIYPTGIGRKPKKQPK